MAAADTQMEEEEEELHIDDFDTNTEVELGAGASGITYKCLCKKDGKYYALKVMRGNTSIDEDADKELKVLRRIKHKNIIGYFGIVMRKERLCLVLEFAQDGDLFCHLYRNKSDCLTSEDKEKIIREICSGLFHLHHKQKKPIRHGDIKSPNILLCRSGEERVAKLADFGLSEELTKTITGDGKRSWRWAAPEIFRSKNSRNSTIKSTKSDIWAVGAVVWELWTERLPFDGKEEFEVIRLVGDREMTPYNPESGQEIPAAYSEFLRKCFEFDHESRWTIEDAYNYLMQRAIEVDGEDEDDVASVWTNSNLPMEDRDLYTQAVSRFMTELDDDKLFNKVKSLFRTELAEGVRQRLRSPWEFMDCLEKRAISSPRDTSQLEKRLRMLGVEGERLARLFSDRSSVPPPREELSAQLSIEECEAKREAADCEGLLDREGTAGSEMSEERNESPPDNFRDFSVAPTQKELTDTAETVFLRKNKVKGEYESVDDYLDVHFRLMREDFMIPLREGIIALKNVENTESKMPTPQVFILRNATVQYPVCLRNGIGHVVRFDTTRYKNACWDRNKRFMFGSLLCFFTQDFTRSLFAIVAKRDANALRQRGELTVQFITESLGQSSLAEKFILIESSAYFEAYRHVLTRLKAFREATFPLAQHIVYCDREVEAPEYLKRDPDMLFDFQRILTKENDGTKVEAKPLDLEAWPSKEKLGLDGSQYLALKAAITHRIALIQGPPGTGKTFMGLKITKLLLENVVKRQKNFGPMLVISYTNHALDQFIEAIANFGDVKIVRVGSQSKSDIVSQFTLSRIRQEYIEGRNFSRQSSSEIKKLRDEIQDLFEQITDKSARLRATREHVLNIRVLKELVQPKHYDNIVGPSRAIRDKQVHDKMKEWLSEIIDEELLIQEMEQLNVSASGKGDGDGDDDDDDAESSQSEDEAMVETTRRKLESDNERNDTNKKLDQKIQGLIGKDFIKWDDPKAASKDDSKTKVFRQFLQRQLDSDDCMSQEEEESVKLPQQLSSPEKWRLYRLWRHFYCLSLHKSLEDLKNRYEASCTELEKKMMDSDRIVLGSRQVIAMTTTGASRYGEILSVLKPKIVVVEEAAEVLESHVVAALSESCEHLILIGDHKQLRPKTTTQEIARKYRLEVSLFERLIVNKFHYDTLGLQHRMRPEIANLLRQENLYPKLEDHDSVMHFPENKGVAYNFFFLSHEHRENQEENRSFSNDFEARYADRLCKHLLMQGYGPEKVTVLTLYSGQYSKLTRQRTISGESRKGLKVAVVDNYQGEENDIIILSLVRSNERKAIGFAGINNRICVAISRARMGLYVLGNVSQFRIASALWADVIRKAEARGLVGPDLELTCQLHPESAPMAVRSVKDFDEKAPDGGCSRACPARLPCGHVCKKACHPTDRDHTEYKCQKLVDVEWKDCGHQVPCFRADMFEKCCKEKCEYILGCGHPCEKKCGEPHTSICAAMDTRISPFCGHEVQIKCGSQDRQAVCAKPCKEQLRCGHMCSGFCSKCSEGRLHEACRKKCNHTLVCGHACEECHPRECRPCQKSCELHCPHSECNLPCGERCRACKEKCTNTCQHQACSKLCHETCSVPPCDRACKKKFSCPECKKKVDCLGLCGEKCINLCRCCDAHKLSRFYLNSEDDENQRSARFLRLETCQHIFEVSALDKWMLDDPAAAVGVKRCPRCNTTITLRSCKRYMNCVRKGIDKMRAINDIVADDDKMEEEIENLNQHVLSLNLRNVTALSKNDKFLQVFRSKAKKVDSAFELLHCEGVLSMLQDLEENSGWIVRFKADGLKEDLLNGAKHILDGLLSAFSRPMTSEALEQCRMETLRFAALRRICQHHRNHRGECEGLWIRFISNWEVKFSRQTHSKIMRRIEKLEDN